MVCAVIFHMYLIKLEFISYLVYFLHCFTLPAKRCLSHGMCLYQVMMTLYDPDITEKLLTRV